MSCRHGLNEDCDPCELAAEHRRHERKGERLCFGCRRTWLEREYPHDECEECRLESGAAKWCERCEDVVVDADAERGICAPCLVIRENAEEQASIDRDNDRFFGGGRS